MVQRALRPSALVPPGFVVESAICEGTATVITVRASGDTSLCPGCKSSSGRIHSRYQRCLSDPPLAGRPVRLMVVARRFRCDTTLCARRIFTERFDNTILVPWARRTTQLDFVVHHLGLALGGRPTASFAGRLIMPVSNDTLLRVVRRRGCPSFAGPNVIGIDDRAWRRNQRYGTIIRDLERRRPDVQGRPSVFVRMRGPRRSVESSRVRRGPPAGIATRRPPFDCRSRIYIRALVD